MSIAKLWELETCRPDLVLGHSFGEYAAACASGAITPEDAFRIVQFRGQLAYEVNLKHSGLMAAINGQIDMPYIQRICRIYKVDIAVVNSPEQVIISGEYASIENASRQIEKEGLKIIPLETGAPFHSRYFTSKQPAFRRFLNSIPFYPPHEQLLMNATARLETNPQKIKDCLAAQLTNPVNFPKIIRALEATGADSDNIQEIGNRKILTGFVRKILKRP